MAAETKHAATEITAIRRADGESRTLAATLPRRVLEARRIAANVIHGGGGNDIVNGGSALDSGVDQLFGDDGNDRLIAGNGNDEMTGGAGVDMFTIESMNMTGHWVIHDYEAGEKVYLFQPPEELSWSSSSDPSNPWVMATMADGDSVTFMGLTDWASIDITQTTSIF